MPKRSAGLLLYRTVDGATEVLLVHPGGPYWARHDEGAWSLRGDLDVRGVRSNTFTLEWPRGSGSMQDFPEVDRAGWFGIEEARAKLLKGQRPLLDRLVGMLRDRD
jgi:predicted NUDIX family NTP pyrophosphohydrolase